MGESSTNPKPEDMQEAVANYYHEARGWVEEIDPTFFGAEESISLDDAIKILENPDKESNK